jgi:NADPH-dependent curcumin reductase CurA
MPLNTAVRLAQRPVGQPQAEDWAITSGPLPTPGPGTFVVRITQLSLDPAMRGWLDDRPSYLPPVQLGDVMRAMAVGEVVASEHPNYPDGTVVLGTFGVQEYALSDGTGVTKVNPGLGTPAMYLGVLGTTGLTAYFGLLEHGRPRAGDTVLVSAAAGAVGSIVGQLARIGGARAVGIAGGPDKCQYVAGTLGFDDVIDYKSESMREALPRTCGAGIDVYFDNVGGPILNAALANLAMHARVVVCGAISQYNADAPVPGPSNYMSLLVRRASMTGFLVFDHAAEYSVARKRLAAWVSEGLIVAPETIVNGSVSDFPDTLLRLFSGDSVGKLILDITASESSDGSPA